ncbi:MAG: PAS domain S-box protein [Candidatus Hermodarchaeota archaeon]
MESEEIYKLITENANDLIRVLNEQFQIEFINETAHLKTLGYSKEDLIGQTAISLNNPKDYSSVRRFMRKMIKSGEAIHEIRIRHKNGHYIWFEIKAKIFKDQKNQTKYLFVSRDITERNETEKFLKESEEKFRKLFEKANDGILLTEAETEKILNGNKKICQMLGYSLEELQNMRYADLHPEDSLSYIDYQFKHNLQDKSSIARDIPMKRKDGSIFYCNVNNSEIELGGKKFFIGLFRDITERKKAEEKLRESETKFRNIAEQSFMGIVIVQDGELKYMNQAMSKISGYPINEILNWSQKDMFKMIYHEDLRQVSNRLQSNIEKTMGPFSSNTFRIINKNGELRWLEDYTTRIIYQGAPANLISIIDITDKKEAERLILEENKRLLELHELRKDLITRVSHELKTPLTSIYGTIQILLRNFANELSEGVQNHLQIGYRGCLRLKQLVDNLLDVSRLDAKKIKLELKNEDLIEFIEDCVNEMNYLARTRGIAIKSELPHNIYSEIDKLRFRQVLTNIISNAIKNTPRGGNICINLITNNDYIDIQVKDTGVGLTPKEKTQLFEKFGKIERYGMDLDVDIEGSGIGLYISKEITELHGGKILVESEGRNKGSTFTIRLYKI